MVAGFFGDNNSDSGSPTDSVERSESLVESVSIQALFPANKSDTDGSSESNEIPPIFSNCPNSIASFFSPARSSVSENYYEITYPNPSIRANEPTSLSISLLFPPTMSETETNDSCSGFDEAVEARFSNSIVSFFPPAKSQTDSVSENDDINPTDPSTSQVSARPTRRTIQTPARSSVSENPSIRANEPTSLSISLLFPPTMSETETNDSCSEFDEAVEARFSYSIESFFPPAKSQTDSVSEDDDINPTDPSIPASARPTRGTIQTTSFRGKFLFPNLNLPPLINNTNKLKREQCTLVAPLQVSLPL